MTIENGSSVSLDAGLVTPFVESIDNAASNGTWSLIFLHLFPFLWHFYTFCFRVSLVIMSGPLLVFDFDHTIAELNTDVEVCTLYTHTVLNTLVLYIVFSMWSLVYSGLFIFFSFRFRSLRQAERFLTTASSEVWDNRFCTPVQYSTEITGSVHLSNTVQR